MKNKTQIGFYLLTWAGMFLTANGRISSQAGDAAIYPSMDAAQGAADDVPAHLHPILICSSAETEG